MAGLLSLCSFASDTGGSYDFLGSNTRLQKFVGTYPGRVSERPRMQENGRWPVVPLRDASSIAHEGMLVATDGDPATLIGEHDGFKAALVGDASVRPTLPRDGVLTVQYAGWAESASADVAVESQSVELNKDNPKTAPYLVSWIVFAGYFVGDSSGDLYYP